MSKTLEQALDEVVADIKAKQKKNTRYLAKIHKLKRENRVLSDRRKAILQCKEHYNKAKYHYYCKEDFKILFLISEEIGKNSAKILRLRTLIKQSEDIVMKVPDHFECYKFYSEEDACIEICHDTEYTYSDAILFVESLGYEIKEGGDMWYDDMFKDWRGYVNVVVSK